ncbi:hypothetical protein BB560_001578 [Smittium megazygosporum]|uniref:ATP-dependent RNA helicase n=1 Tax=Smittium megazygosporum TaxID=133381 RepID=A0A2T9ZH67_9FUNG|nr:hypothetical protein BB560_001578 [Smittium megazygosporum]
MFRIITKTSRLFPLKGIPSAVSASLKASSAKYPIQSIPFSCIVPQQSYFRSFSSSYTSLNSQAMEQPSTSDQIVLFSEYEPIPFSSYSSVNPNTLKAIKSEFKFDCATKVQNAIISQIPSDQDFLIKAKTGTGKTIGFLISAIETLLKNKKSGSYDKDSVGILIVSPTRELAKQIANEASKLSTFHKFGVHELVGGESIRNQTRSLSNRPKDIVVGTPGRLLDLWDSFPEFGRAASKTQILVFDEADMLLDLGFQKEINDIVSRCPRDRQNFLVSATFSSKVRQTARKALEGKSFKELDCVDPNESSVVKKIKQSYILANWDAHYHLISKVVASHIAEIKEKTGAGAKILIFLPTTKSVQVYSSVLSSMLSKSGTPLNKPDKSSRFRNHRAQYKNSVKIFSIHGKKSQDVRTRTSDNFRKFDISNNNTGILITTDVSARGVDYPGTSLVLQVGVPKDPQQYTHRVGRTGRAGTYGEGITILSEFELPFIRSLSLEQGVELKESEVFNSSMVSDLVEAIELTKKEADTESGETKDSTTDQSLEAKNELIPFVKKHSFGFERYKNEASVEEIEDMFISCIGYYQSLEGILRYKVNDLISQVSRSMLPFGIDKIPHLPLQLRLSLGIGRPSGNSKSFSRNNYSRNNSSTRYKDDSRFNDHRHGSENHSSSQPRFNGYRHGSENHSSSQPRFNRYGSKNNRESSDNYFQKNRSSGNRDRRNGNSYSR